MPGPQALTVPAVRARKRSAGAEPLVMVTAYDAPGARLVADGGADLLLVGDSLAMVVLGYDDTLQVTVDDMAHHTAAVARGLASWTPSTEEARRPLIDGCEYQEALQAVAVEGGVAGNVVPDEAVLVVNHRFAPDRTADEAAAHVQAVLGTVAGFEVTEVAPAAPPSLGHPLLRALIDRNRLPVRAKLGWTDPVAIREEAERVMREALPERQAKRLTAREEAPRPKLSPRRVARQNALGRR